MGLAPLSLTVGGIPRAWLLDGKHRSNVRATLPANLTGELWLKIRQPDIVGPSAGVDRGRMRAAIVLAIDEKPGRAGLPHFPENDFPFPQHAALKRDGQRFGKPLRVGDLTVDLALGAAR